MKKICKECNKEFSTTHSKSEFCSMDCSGHFRRNKNIVERSCKKCGRIFRPRQIDDIGKYCSAECAGTTRNGKKLRKCQYCGKEEMVTSSKSTRKFCSWECSRRGAHHYFTEDGLERLKASKRGRNNYNYKGGTIKPINRSYYTSSWKKLTYACKKRDDFICQRCKHSFDSSKLRAHHIIYKVNGGDDSLENLITYCNSCHQIVHWEENIIYITS
jgi:hypothetical protein